MEHKDPAVVVPFQRHDGLTAEKYADMKRQAQAGDTFWLDVAKRLRWNVAPTRGNESRWSADDVRIKWYADGVLNACDNCVDRHAETDPDLTALIWVSDDGETVEHITFADLRINVMRWAAILQNRGVVADDPVTMYLPMVPEAVYVMLACARIGAVHSVVFAGFSPAALAGRINDCGSRVVITADSSTRGGKHIPLKANVDAAVTDTPSVEHVVVVRRSGEDVPMHETRDSYADPDSIDSATLDIPCVPRAATDPLFILYTSGSTGTPKGLVHSTGGYLTYASFTHQLAFDPVPGEPFWCSADVGWVTGHSYIVYGSLANKTTNVIYEGVPNVPDASQMWRIVDQLKVRTVYSAPTAIRALMRAGDRPVRATSRASITLLGTVGEPINPEAWRWYFEVVGEQRCPIVDTWWQTETGAAMITPIPGVTPLKPGSATMPLPGIDLELLDDNGEEVNGEGKGVLYITRSWPGQSMTIHGNHQRFIETYFSQQSGRYFSGDGARRDADDYWFVTGRVDDAFNVAGHLLGTAEIESALVAHPAVSEAAVVGIPDSLKGHAVHCWVLLTEGVDPTDQLNADLVQQVRREIGPIATPSRIRFAPGLPKTRSGKIMRRILRAVATGALDSLGDTSTLAEPSIVQELVDAEK